jgi:hypothetical protein
MGLMDKAKEAAMQAKASAEKLAQQGQAKVAEVQQHRSEAELYRTLGEAYYTEQRRGGDHEAVVAALNALDQHFAGAASNTPPESGGTASGEGGSYSFDNM